MQLTDWSALTAPLVLPIAGKNYTVPPVSLEAGAQLEAIKTSGTLPEGMTGSDSWRLALGSAYDEMVADNVPSAALKRAGMAATIDHEFDRDLAERFWQLGSIPKALAELAAQAEMSSSPASRQSPNTESDNPTSSASTTNTTSPRVTSTRATKKRGQLRSA